MKKLNFAIEIKSLDGKVVVDELGPMAVNKVLGNLLQSSRTSKDACGDMLLASAIYLSEGEVELEDAQYNRIKQVVSEAQVVTAVKAAIENVLKG